MLRKLQIIPLPKLYLGPTISSRPSDDEDDSASSSKAPPRSASPGSLSQTHTPPKEPRLQYDFSPSTRIE